MVPDNNSKLYYKVVGNNIKKYRQIKNLTLQALGEMIGVTKKTIQRYENGEIRIDMDRLADIATALKIGNSALLEGAEKFLGISTDSIQMVNIPIVSRISCGNGVLAFDEIEDYEPTPASWLNGGDYFYARVIGDSMINARIKDGDLALIRCQPSVENGEIAAAVLDDSPDNQVYLKRVYKRNGTLILQSENPAYPPIICDSKSTTCRIVGKLKRIVISF